MKRLLLCLAFLGSFSTPLLAQEQDYYAEDIAVRDMKIVYEQNSVGVSYRLEIPNESEYSLPDTSGVHYQPHSLGINYRLGVINTAGFQTYSFDIYTKQREGRSRYSPLISLRFNAPFSSTSITNIGGYNSVGFLFGGSQYSLDYRSRDTGLGLSMLVNGGVTLDISLGAEYDTYDYRPVVIGGEVDIKVLYNFNRYVASSFGISIGYALSPNIYDVFSDMRHGLLLGVTMGLVF